MDTNSRSPWARWLVFLALALLASGFAVAENGQPKAEPLQEIASDAFHERLEDFLESPESGDVPHAFDLDRVWVLMGRLAWVQGDVDATVGSDGVSRPFAELLVRVRGEWKTVFSWVDEGSRSASRSARAKTSARAGCSCGPCAGCSSRRGR